jgi:hypothetical protein
MSTAPPLAFTDVESVGLVPRIHPAWEFAVIRRADGRDTEHVFRVEPDLTNADPKALEMNHYYERTSADDWYWQQRQEVADAMYPLLDGAVMVGSNPSFDADMIAALLDGRCFKPRPWHYRTIDVATLAAGYLYGKAEALTDRDCDASWYDKVAERIGWPWKSYNASEAAGIPRPAAGEAHTALGDARWARDLFDQVAIPNAFYTASDDQLAQMAGDALSRRGGAA